MKRREFARVATPGVAAASAQARMVLEATDVHATGYPTVAAAGAMGRKMEAASRSIMVFYVPMLVVLGLVTYIQVLTLWLPQLLLGR